VIRAVAVLLLAWEPLSFAIEALTVLPTITYRGWPAVVELVFHGLVAAVAASGGLALLNRTPSAAGLATVAIVLSVSRTIQATWWTALPNSTPPGAEALTTGIVLVVGAVAVAIVQAAGPAARRPPTGSERSFR